MPNGSFKLVPIGSLVNVAAGRPWWQMTKTPRQGFIPGSIYGVLSLGEWASVLFFGTPACTTTGIARVALHTDAAVVPGYAVWDEAIGKYRLRFEPAVELRRSEDGERDVIENTQRFAKIIEEIVKRYPEQWVWVHARWKMRPEGEKDLYGAQNGG